MKNLQYSITTWIYLILGVLLIVMTARTKPIKDLTHILHLLSKNQPKAMRRFLHIRPDTVMVTRVNPLQKLLCKDWKKIGECVKKCSAPTPSPTPSSTPSPKSHCMANCWENTPLSPSPQCKNLHTDTSNMHKETEQFQNLQACALTIGFILVFLSIFRFLTLLVN